FSAFFQFYSVPDGNVALITRSALRSLLTDLNQIPAIVGESCTPSCVEIATHSCFHGVLNSAIVEEKFLSWLRLEPAVLLWLPTCYRLSATEMISHQARCRVCKIFPITGLRYRCLKCLNFDLCQVCFFTGCLSKPHKRSHPVVEHCVQMSAKANAKHFLRTIRNNLFRERCRRKEAQRRRALEIVEERHFPTHKKTYLLTLFPSVCSVPSVPVLIHSNKSMHNCCSKFTQGCSKTRAKQFQFHYKSVNYWYRQTSCTEYHGQEGTQPKGYMKQQFNKWKDKMQFLQNCQEDKSCKIEANLQSLRASHENLQTKLQQMKQEVKTMLQSSEHPFAQCQNTMPRNPRVLLERRMQGGLNPAQIRPTSRTCADWKSLNSPDSANSMQLLQTPEVPTAVHFMFSEDPLESVSLQRDRHFIGQYKKAKESQTYLPELTENALSGIMKNTVLTPTAVQISPDEKEVGEEVELQQLVMKLKDALSLQAQPAQQSALKQKFFSTAEHLCRSFSDLINQVTSPACETTIHLRASLNH
ncbi:DYTN protein, partial [Nyctiprogne leucopyga]|nr:DYTN protein [Nyctiprogne leucopyga]